ncbi:hypothetical protein FRB93_010985 [Tulasnella sp. JGI-2019a]|nr:hypothetical protein FRB93_010985 [Tulasnella sp. JGI-2019a]
MAAISSDPSRYSIQRYPTLAPPPQPHLQHPSHHYGYPYASQAPPPPPPLHSRGYFDSSTSQEEQQRVPRGGALENPRTATLYGSGGGGMQQSMPEVMQSQHQQQQQQPQYAMHHYQQQQQQHPGMGPPLPPLHQDYHHQQHPQHQHQQPQQQQHMVGLHPLLNGYQPPPPPKPDPPTLDQAGYADVLNIYGYAFNTVQQHLFDSQTLSQSTTEQCARMPAGTLNALLQSAISGLEKLDPSTARQYSELLGSYLIKAGGGDARRQSGASVGSGVGLNAVAPAAIEVEVDGSNGRDSKKTKRGGGDDKNGDDPQECLTCHAKSSPEWRRGPLGPRTLCNACGLVYIKIMKRRSKGLPDEEDDEEGGEEAGDDFDD